MYTNLSEIMLKQDELPPIEHKASVPVPRPTFTPLERTWHHACFRQDGEPYVLHIVKSGHKDDRTHTKPMYFVFWEDAFGTEPWQGGFKLLSKESILQEYGIEL